MDRLEKALEKSRQQRAEAIGGSSVLSSGPAQGSSSRTVTAQKSSGPNTPSYAYVAPTTSEVDEAQMERNRIVAHHTRSPKADVYRQLRTQVLQIMHKTGLRSLAITSPHYGDGKTTVAINLAVSMAQDVKQTVLMVDLDLRKPNLHTYLGVESNAGLTDYLLHDVPVHECLLRQPFNNRMSLLPAGFALDHSSELLGTPKMIALAHELKTRYDDRIVIYDMPPVLDQDDPIAFLPQVEAVLLVIRDGVTRTDEVKRCLNILSGVNVIGTVLNNCW